MLDIMHGYVHETTFILRRLYALLETCPTHCLQKFTSKSNILEHIIIMKGTSIVQTLSTHMDRYIMYVR